MTKKTKTRLYLVSSGLALAFLSVWLILAGIKDNISFFYPPSKIPNYYGIFRIGGFVKKGSAEKVAGKTIFVITDGKKDVKTIYEGNLPALFAEGEGIVAKGKFNEEKIFVASELLAKHDENYRPPDLGQ